MNTIKKRRVCAQICKFRARFAQCVDTVLNDVIPATLLKHWITQEIGCYRERIYSPLRTLTLFLQQVLSADQSCQDAVARGLSEQVGRGLQPCSLNNSSYCDARKRLPLKFLMRLGREIGIRLAEQQPVDWLWRARQVKLVDGTTVSMPDTRANQECYPQNHEQKPGLGFPIARLVAIISLSCGSVMEWAVAACEGKQTGETSLLWKLSSHFKRGDVLLADRCYSGYFMVALMASLGVDVVLRQHPHRITDFERGKQLGKRDHVVQWIRPTRPPWMDLATYQSMPATLTMREVRSSQWTLVTTFIDPADVTKAELLAMYQLRWQVELDLRSIKEVMQMDILRCKSPAMIEKEIAVHLLAYNLVRLIMAQAAYLGKTLPWRLSFKATLQVLRTFSDSLCHCSPERGAIRCRHMLIAIARLKLPKRPGRVEPRVKKRRSKQQSLLTQPRQNLREKLMAQKEMLVAAGLT